jgi:hypothetical protein
MRYALSSVWNLKSLERSSALNQGREPHKADTPASYRIRVEGPLDKRWSEYLCGMVISSARRRGAPTVTTLSGKLTDMAALMGVLNTVYDLGFTLLKVERLASSETGSDIKARGDMQ